MTGDGALFTREDTIEAAWAVVDPVLKTHHRALAYKRSSWGRKRLTCLSPATDRGSIRRLRKRDENAKA